MSIFCGKRCQDRKDARNEAKNEVKIIKATGNAQTKVTLAEQGIDYKASTMGMISSVTQSVSSAASSIAGSKFGANVLTSSNGKGTTTTATIQPNSKNSVILWLIGGAAIIITLLSFAFKPSR